MKLSLTLKRTTLLQEVFGNLKSAPKSTLMTAMNGWTQSIGPSREMVKWCHIETVPQKSADGRCFYTVFVRHCCPAGTKKKDRKELLDKQVHMVMAGSFIGTNISFFAAFANWCAFSAKGPFSLDDKTITAEFNKFVMAVASFLGVKLGQLPKWAITS